ncbi:DMT family transporter [Maritalea mediterranea]|uniref:DMT family transporter n=1 Tax=Maritalea mediterranea TaxID=2909667 RepID=A0ABS9E4D2_9HYPH|nr:DMT family transporter [Maritalea mediterranea]MCF4097735.1 DMT family transporter [Maritalea mediterranea]
MNIRLLAILAGLSTIGIYALQFVGARFSLTDVGETARMTSTDLTIVRIIASGLFFLPIVRQRHVRAFVRLGWKRIIVLTFLAGAPYPFLINIGLDFTPAAHAAAILPSSVVLFSSIIGMLAFKAPVSLQSRISLILIGGGMGLFVCYDLLFDPWALPGDLILFAVGAGFAYFSLTVRDVQIDPLAVTAGVVWCSWPLMVPMFLAMPSNLLVASSAEILSQAIIQGVLSGAIALFLTTFAARHLGSQTASLFLVGIPIATALLGAVALGEYPIPLEMVALSFMAIGIGLPATRFLWLHYKSARR